MTNFGSIFKQMTFKRIKAMNNLFLLILAMGIIATVTLSFTDNTSHLLPKFLISTLTCSLMIFAGQIGYLCLYMSREAHQNRYRLLPISDKKLYLSSTISSLLSYMYVIFINVLFFFIFVLISYQFDENADKFLDFSSFSMEKSTDIKMTFVILIIALLGIMTIILLVSTIDILGTIITDTLPGGKQIVIKIVIYILASILIGWLFELANSIGQFNINQNTILSIGELFEILFGMGEVIVLTIVNMNLLKLMETNK